MKYFILNCYKSWIDDNIPKDEIVGNCTLWARVMSQAFPELILVGGYVNKIIKPVTDDIFSGCSLGLTAFNNSYHEYLITEDGDIVDPTAIQFDAMIGENQWEYDRIEEHLLYWGR